MRKISEQASRLSLAVTGDWFQKSSLRSPDGVTEKMSAIKTEETGTVCEVEGWLGNEEK